MFAGRNSHDKMYELKGILTPARHCSSGRLSALHSGFQRNNNASAQQFTTTYKIRLDTSRSSRESKNKRLAAKKQQLPPPHKLLPCEACGRGAGILSVSASVASCQRSRRVRGGMGSEAPSFRLKSRHWAVRVRCSGVPVSDMRTQKLSVRAFVYTGPCRQP